MPGISGADLRQRLIADGNDIPVIFITACFDEMARAATLKRGACGFLRKPFGEGNLIECLESALSQGTSAKATHYQIA
jgi:FixJ family two-component response regulator